MIHARPQRLSARALLFAALAAGMTTPVRAQQAGPEPGAEVRLTFPCDGGSAGPRQCRVRGTVLRVTPQLIEIAAAAGPQVHPVGQIERLDVAAGTMSHWRSGAVIGFVAGAGVTLMILSAGGSGGLCDTSADQDAMGWAGCFGIAGAGGVAAGGLGALLGSLHRTTRWREVALPGSGR